MEYTELLKENKELKIQLKRLKEKNDKLFSIIDKISSVIVSDVMSETETNGLYTYDKNQLKFWICLVVTVIVSIFGLSNDWPNVVYLIISFYIWLYSIIDNSTKSYKFYSDYPYG